MNIRDFSRMKAEGEKISATTAYDHWSARIINRTEIDFILVGDSAAMVVFGYPDTVHATVDMIAPMVEAVRRGAPDKFVVADLPFLTFRKGIEPAMVAVDRLMKAGASAVKLEGIRGHEDVVFNITQSGVPVMGHLGLTPQSVHGFGGFRVQGRDKDAVRIQADAGTLVECGCFSIVLEGVPSHLAELITESVSIPTIGIGAGPGTDGQILVLQDLCGFNSEFKPKFVRTFCDGESLVEDALNSYDAAIQSGDFPSENESYR